MKLDKVSTYLDADTNGATFSLPSAAVAIKKVGRDAGCEYRVARCRVQEYRAPKSN